MEFIEQVLDSLLDMRVSEGKVLEAELLGRCQDISANLNIIARRAPGVLTEYRDRLASRVEELIGSGRISVDEDIIAREVAIFAERSDIAEEINRLEGHLNQFRQAAELPKPSGRKLDFIAQEMLREANTIASKSNDSQIAQGVVEIKTAVDRIKEQAANVE